MWSIESCTELDKKPLEAGGKTGIQHMCGWTRDEKYWLEGLGVKGFCMGYVGEDVRYENGQEYVHQGLFVGGSYL